MRVGDYVFHAGNGCIVQITNARTDDFHGQKTLFTFKGAGRYYPESAFRPLNASERFDLVADPVHKIVDEIEAEAHDARRLIRLIRREKINGSPVREADREKLRKFQARL